ncbi:MAG: hypothetical protein EBY07_15085 [Actinobacteria bacterium]|nr:hypothetical protein [Actinomycetota bacterium]
MNVIADFTGSDVPNPGVKPQRFPVAKLKGRYLRVTATKLAPRRNDYIYALAELQAIDPKGRNVALGATVTSLDSIEAGPRWGRLNLTDGYFYGPKSERDDARIALLERERAEIRKGARKTDPAADQKLAELTADRSKVAKELATLPAPQVAYVGTIHKGTGSFTGTGANGGKPRPIFVLKRGDVSQPDKEVGPGNLARLRTHPNRAVANAAANVLEKLSPEAGQKDDLIAKLMPEVTKAGNVANGRMVFTAACAICHKYGDIGVRDVGPPLAGIGAKSTLELLTHIVDPNRQVEPNYWQWNLTTKKGETLVGVIVNENANTVTIRNQGGDTEVRREDITGRENTRRSLMPEGLEGLGANQFDDEFKPLIVRQMPRRADHDAAVPKVRGFPGCQRGRLVTEFGPSGELPIPAHERYASILSLTNQAIYERY